MSNLTGVASVVAGLRNEKENLKRQLSKLDAALAVLGSLNGASRGGVKRTMSLAGRRRIAAAQRARWAKVRASKNK